MFGHKWKKERRVAKDKGMRWFCRWLRALSSVLRLGRYRACRPARGNPSFSKNWNTVASSKQCSPLNWCFTFFSQSDGLLNRMLSVHFWATIHKPGTSLLVSWLLFIGRCPSNNRIQQLFTQLQIQSWGKSSLLTGVSLDYLSIKILYTVIPGYPRRMGSRTPTDIKIWGCSSLI